MHIEAPRAMLLDATKHAHTAFFDALVYNRSRSYLMPLSSQLVLCSDVVALSMSGAGCAPLLG